ncbi:DUF4011 domain-containing protein [Marinovum sp.]|uniref:DUF4011 domain-containing protein n=1 Tax=Marinovum sp. TaxID=2024839 RepID=UPI003A94E7AF
MTAHSSAEQTTQDYAETSERSGICNLVRDRIQHLRARLLDSSRRNPLIQVPFRQNSSSLIRFVDELPGVLAERLHNQRPMRLVALPPIDEPLPDEQTDEFLDALEIARTTDEKHLADSAALDPTDPEYGQKEIDLERALKDRVRAELGLPERQTEENTSLAAHARNHGISPDYILPKPSESPDDGRHDDADIQTLLLPERLDRVGRSLHDRGHAFERETGVNVLHAVFGILEWNEPGSSRTPARSPLLLLEVRMSRKKAPGGAEYHICGENELGLNTTLAQTLSAQFGLELPAYDEGSVEDYLAAVTDLAPSGWHWSVRREALVGVFPSSRIAMYRDLDPDNGHVVESPLIEEMLSSVGGDGATYAEVYDTDDPDVERQVPRLVMDADASQFSSLVDVANGTNVAIEGPPGSGKSQTIVNLIASAMADGKKVLFVAEKLTALDVVRNRLDSAGLGEFILPLQAGRGSRDAVFQSLEDRLGMERPPAGSAAAHRARHEALTRRRSEMQAYLDMLGTKLGACGMTVHEAVGRAIATAQHIDGLPRDIRRLRISAPETLEKETRTEIEGDARMVVDRLHDADRIAALWREARKAPLRADEAEDIATDLAALARAIEAFRTETKDGPLRAFLPDDPVLARAAPTRVALAAIVRNPDTDADLVDQLLDVDMRRAAFEVCEARDAATAAAAVLVEILTDPEDDEVDSTIASAADMAGRQNGTIDPAAMAAEIERLDGRRGALTHRRDLATALPARWAKISEGEGLTLSDLRLDIERLLRTPTEVLDRRQPDEARLVPSTAREASASQRALARERDTLRERLPRAGNHASTDLKTAADAIDNAGLFRFLSARYKAAWALYSETLGGDPEVGRPAAASALRDYARWAEKRDAFASDTRLATQLGALFSGVDSDPETLDALASFHETIGQLSQGDDRLRYALETGSLQPLRDFVAEAEMPSTSLSGLVSDVDASEKKLKSARDEREEAARLCLSFKGRSTLDHEMIERARQARARRAEAQLAANSSRAAELVASIEATEEIRTAVLIAEAISGLPEPRAGIMLMRRGADSSLIEEADRIFARHEELAREAAAVAGELALPCADGDDPETALHALASRLPDLHVAARRAEGLIDQARLLRALAALEARGLQPLTDWVQSEEGQTQRANLPVIVEAIYARSLTDHLQARFGRTLDAYDGADLNRLRRDIARIDRELTNLSRLAIREELIENSHPPVGNGIGKVGTYTEMSLIRHELNKQRNRVGVRDLTARAGAALIDLKPCWMMSPLAVAQYLHGQFAFDLVVIDEASQMTPENALGAIMRARQVVIVGDTKQLPPTNFFSKVLDDSDEDEDVRTDSESILDMANTTFTPVRQLRWHYRSRHLNLIAISNKMVYDGQLTIFPAARDGDPELGVELVKVEGEYRKGRNIPEARAIVAGAIQHMRDHPERSLGLATMNKDQTELIVTEFERERARNPHVEAYIERWAERDDGLEEFFVKNLETIQGDERDVIMISTLYGPDPETGKTYQRFGPVNSVHGHRRLNVLFSRAKEKIVTYSSMVPTDIQADGKAYGVQMLRAWLEFSRTGQLGDIQVERGETDSPFEDFVIAQIEAAGYEAVPQVGASGFKIDIGVRHPDWPYGFILAVECDGAPYHSSRSSRDRDRLRQQVLEGLGWHFHRIWSTDWFRDPRGQIEKLRAALDAALARAKTEEAERQQTRAEAVERARKAAEEAATRAAETEEAAKAERAEMALAKKAAKTDAKAEPNDARQGRLFEEPSTVPSVAPDVADIGRGPKPSLSEQALARIEQWREDQAYDCFNRTATTRKRGFYWLGFLEGIAASDAIEDGEYEGLIAEAREIDAFFGDAGESRITDMLTEALEDSGGDLMTAISIQCEALRETLDDPAHAAEKDIINTFLGFCAGIICDGRITSGEARKIYARFHSDPALAKAPIFVHLRWAVDEALADAVLDEEEAEEIREWIAELVTDGHADTGVANIGGALSPTDPITDAGAIDLEGKTFVLTGKMSMGPRSLIGNEIARRGGILKNTVSDETHYVVVSNTASRHWKTTHYGTKIEAALRKIEAGHAMRFVAEHALASALVRLDT